MENKKDLRRGCEKDWKDGHGVAIIILNWNGWRDTVVCLDSVQQFTYPDYLTVVVDNGSRDDSVEKIRNWAKSHLGGENPLVEYTRSEALVGGETAREDALDRRHPSGRLVLIRSEENLGFCAGNNLGIGFALRRESPADYVFLLNNDAKAERDCLSQLVSVSREADAGVVGALIKEEASGETKFRGYNGSFPLFRQFFYPFLRWPEPTPGSDKDYWECFWVSGTAMLIRAETLRQVYGSTGRYLDERLFLYGDELDFCCAARRAGYKSVTTKRAVVYHGEAKSSGGRFNPLAYYYSSRNRTLLASGLLSMPWRALFHIQNLMMCTGRVLTNLIQKRLISVRAILLGLIDGYRGKWGRWKHHDREWMRYQMWLQGKRFDKKVWRDENRYAERG